MNTAKHSLLIETWHYFDKTYGNSYWAGRVLLDGGEIASIPMTYGYGNQHEYDIHRLLVCEGLLPKETETNGLWTASEKANITCYRAKHENAKLRDLKRYGEKGRIVTYPLWIKACLLGIDINEIEGD